MIIVLIALGVHSCQVSANNSALQSYTSRASSLIQQSNANGAALFKTLSGAASVGAAATQNAVNSTELTARRLLDQVKGLNVPGPMQSAHEKLHLTLKMRLDGIDEVAKQIQPAIAGSTTALDAIALQVARFYASDVVYKDYAAPEIASAMNSAGVKFNPLPSGQFVPSLSWLDPTYVAKQLHVKAKTTASGSPCQTSPCGHALNSVSVNGTSLQTGSPNTVSSTTPTFTLNFTNSGKTAEHDVVCKVTVNGTSVSGTHTVHLTEPGKSYSCAVTLSSAAPAGTQTIVADIEPVPGENNTSNNSNTYPVTFP